MTAPPFFIVGSGRSGTTLLRLILASHSRLSIPPETWFLNDLVDLVQVDGPLPPADVERVIQTITHYPRRWADLNLDAEEFRADVARMNEPRLRDIVEWVYLKVMVRDGKVRWGDKTPGYIAIVPQLAKLFPGAKFIELVRDGRDAAKSYEALKFSGQWLHQNAQEWLDAMACSEKWAKSPLSAQILRVHYEQMVLDTENTVRRICAFLGEDFEPAMLQWPKKLDNFIPARGARMHPNLARMPQSSDVFRWRTKMKPREILVCEAFMARYLKAHGYELRFSGAAWNALFPLVRWYCLYGLPVVSLPPRVLRKIGRLVSGRQIPAARANVQGDS